MVIRPFFCLRFIGRREELAHLHERRREAAASHGGTVLVAGDAGLGKSRLIAEFCGSLVSSRWRVAYGSCSQVAARPYGPVLDALARIDPDAGEIAPAESRTEHFDAIVARFEKIASRTALVVVIEDLHWADATTLEFLAHLGARLRRMRLLLVASVRRDDLHADRPAAAALAKIERDARATRIDLAPLAGVELRSFMDDALAGIELESEVRRSIASAAEGNPFFIEELLKNAVERGPRSATDLARAALPRTLRATLLERLRPFDPAQRRIIAYAAVIGRSFALDLLSATTQTGRELLLETLRRARDVQLLEEVAPGAFRFRHGLTREAIYGDFLATEVRPLHRTIATVLESGATDGHATESLAYHWWAAGDAARSARYNERAGDAARLVYAHEDAIAFYERALEADGLSPLARASLLEKIAERRIALTATEQAQATYEAAAALFGEAAAFEREARCRTQAAIIAYQVGLPDPTAPLDAMLVRLDPAQFVARSLAHLGLAWLAATFGFPTRAAQHLGEVDERARAEVADIRLLYHNVSAWVAMTVGDVAAFEAGLAAWIEAARASGSERTLVAAHVNGAMCSTFFGLHDSAREHIASARRIAGQSRNRYAAESIDAFETFCLLMRGDVQAARAAVERVPASTESHVNATFASAFGSLVGAYLGDDALIAKWFDGFARDAGRKVEIECGAGYAEILVRRGRDADAAALLHRILPECELIRGNSLTLLAVGRYGLPEDRLRARAYLARAADAADSVEAPALVLFDAIALRCAQRPDDARRLAREAATGFARLGIPLLEALALEEAGDPAGAIAVYRRCGAAHDVRRLAADAPRERDQGAAVGGVPVSRREAEIAALVARGATNLEIARELRISHKTVEKHLSSLYEKLGIGSRRELRARVPRG